MHGNKVRIEYRVKGNDEFGIDSKIIDSGETLGDLAEILGKNAIIIRLVPLNANGHPDYCKCHICY